MAKSRKPRAVYNLVESLRSAFQSIRAHTLRSFLTTLGIIIAVMAVIAVVSLIQGFSHSVTTTFASLGTNVLSIQSDETQEDFLAGKVVKVTPDDLQVIQHNVSGISKITPILPLANFGSGAIQYGDQTAYAGVFGTTSSHAENTSFYPVMGRYLAPSDDRGHRRVAVIGQTLLTDLNLPKNPVGQYIEMFGQWFKIIGVLKKLGTIGGQDQDDRVYIPYGTAHSLLGASTVPDVTIQVTVNDIKQMDAVAGRITQLLRRNHNLKPGEDNDFQVQTSEQTLGTFNKVLNSITLVLGGIVGISLLVGGIGIMNIMLVSVTERTREIGICKSLGARRSDILMQFLIEAVTLSLIGGVIGLLLGYGIGVLVAYLVPQFLGAHVPWWAVVLAFGFSGGVGVIFGIAPAAKAASLNPIDALRYE
ncbi:MAG: ABC transporter permease [Gammaproteobacteria bacterium]|nr:ABC transporter permease [Gammaproteobacteria bacterium]